MNCLAPESLCSSAGWLISVTGGCPVNFHVGRCLALRLQQVDSYLIAWVVHNLVLKSFQSMDMFPATHITYCHPALLYLDRFLNAGLTPTFSRGNLYQNRPGLCHGFLLPSLGPSSSFYHHPAPSSFIHYTMQLKRNLYSHSSCAMKRYFSKL
jgi:hypothetical protein